MKLPKVKHDVLTAMDLVSRNNLGGSLSQNEIDELPNIVYVLYKEFSIHVNNKVKENLTSKTDK